MNPPIPFCLCFKCGKLTNETQSIFGIGHLACFMNTPCRNLVNESLNLTNFNKKPLMWEGKTNKISTQDWFDLGSVFSVIIKKV